MSARGSEQGGAGRRSYLLLTAGLFLLLAPLLTLFADRLAEPVPGTPFSAALMLALADILLIVLLSWLYVRAADRGARS